MFDRMDKEAEIVYNTKSSSQEQNDSTRLANEQKVGHDYGQLNEAINDDGGSKYVPEKGSKKKRGKATGSSKIEADENGPDNQESLPMKTKKNQRKSKDTGASDAKSGAKKESDKSKDETLINVSEEWIIQKLLLLFPEFVGLGGLL